MENQPIQTHNERLAALWGAGGRDYDRISATIADLIEHCVIRLDPRPGERVLDVATGTGWAARRVAARGAKVTGVDLGADLIQSAKAIASEEGLPIEFEVGDAEGLRFEDGSFDAVLSTCGVMFTSRPEAAAKELGRVVKKGGRLSLATWLPDSTVAQFFKVMKAYMPAPPASPPPSPFEWGRVERVKELLGASFDLKFETGVSYLREPNGESSWELFVRSYGPTKALAASLDPDRREALKSDWIAFHEKFRTELGIAMPREYLIVLGVRK